jgi:hypothetical protein
VSLENLFQEPTHVGERSELPLLQALIDRYAVNRPFEGRSVVFGHLLVRNSLVVLEGLWRGGAEVVVARAHPSPSEATVLEDLRRHGIPVLEPEDAVRAGEWYLDVGALLGRTRAPRGAAEVTRTGVLHYRTIDCPVVSADDCRAKRIEGFFGTGDSFVRAWRQLRPSHPLAGARVLLFGYGKIGRGVAHQLRRLPLLVRVAEIDPAARARAAREGFSVVAAQADASLHRALGPSAPATRRIGFVDRDSPSSTSAPKTSTVRLFPTRTSLEGEPFRSTSTWSSRPSIATLMPHWRRTCSPWKLSCVSRSAGRRESIPSRRRWTNGSCAPGGLPGRRKT